MTQKLRFIGSAALGILFAWGAQLALAQGVEQRGSAQKGAVVRVAPVSRPLNADLFPRPDSLIATALTESECTGLGGKVTDLATSTCDSGKGCVTAGSDGVMHGACITKQ